MLSHGRGTACAGQPGLSYLGRMLDHVSKSRRRSTARPKRVIRGPQHHGPAETSALARRDTRVTPPQVLELIERARVTQREAEAHLAVLIDHAVGLGIGWPQIAARLGVTRQAARQQYQRRHGDSVSRHDRVA
jgi:hypothetical protein